METLKEKIKEILENLVCRGEYGYIPANTEYTKYIDELIELIQSEFEKTELK